MRKISTKMMIIIIAAVLLVSATVVIAAIATANSTEADPTPSLVIEAKTLSLSDSVYIKYRVLAENINTADLKNVKLLVWQAPPADLKYIKDNGATEISGSVSEKSTLVFSYKDLAAKQMTDVVYAVAYVNINDVDYYSRPVKYSILEYAFNVRQNPNLNDETKTLLAEMLKYGALAQEYKDYETNRLADAEFHLLQLKGGAMLADDHFTYGLYPVGAQVTITAPAVNKDGNVFAGWSDGATTNVTRTITMGTSNTVCEAIYDAPHIDGFKFELNSDGKTYTFKSIGEYTGTTVTVPDTFNGKPVTAIAGGAFASESNASVTTVIIPKSIRSIGEGVFDGCTSLSYVEYKGTATEWNAVTKSTEDWTSPAFTFKTQKDWGMGVLPG